MSDILINQITLDCLVNKETYQRHLRSKKVKQINKEDRKFYRKRIYNLFKEIINGKPPKNLAQDVKYCYDNFINTTIQYFKMIDNSDIIQSEYNGLALDICNDVLYDCSANLPNNIEADNLLMRSIKINAHTLDKLVKRKCTLPNDNIILPQQKEINLTTPELKNKGLQKNNITNIYEDKNSKKKNKEKLEKNDEK